MSPEFALCGEGTSQSPIDIGRTSKAELVEIVFSYDDTPLRVINNGHTIQVNGEAYELLQFHFHSPSEHTVNGKFYDMELHLVHKNDRGELVGIGVKWGKPSKNELREQYTSELFYRFQVSQNLAITPDLQLIINPAENPKDDTIAVFGLRMRLVF